MNYSREEFRLPTGASDDHKSHFSWQLDVYVILVAVAIYYLCVA